MNTPTVQIEANGRNAQNPVEPTLPEGAARSRFKAFQQGMAGSDDLLALDDDAALVAERTQAIAAEYQASSVVGQFLAHRAAVLSVRMDRANLDAAIGSALQIQAAQVDFESARISELDRLEDLLDRRLAMHGARVTLERTPDGIDRLLRFWDREYQAIASMAAPADRRERLAGLLGLTPEEAQNFTQPEFLERIDAERARLRQVDLATRAARLDQLARDRAGVARAARLDPSPQVIQLRRADAAAERAFHRTIRAISDLRRLQAQATPADQDPRPAPAGPIPPIAASATESILPAPAPLGSFRTSINVSAARVVPPTRDQVQPPIRVELPPKKRRDVRQVKSRRR